MLVNVQIENHMLHYRGRALPRCGSFDYVNHTPRGGNKKVLLFLIVVANMSVLWKCFLDFLLVSCDHIMSKCS